MKTKLILHFGSRYVFHHHVLKVILTVNPNDYTIILVKRPSRHFFSSEGTITQFDGIFQHQTHQLVHDPSKMYMKYILHTKYLPIRQRRLNCAGFCQICQAVIMWSIISLFLIFSWQLVLIHLFINCQFYMQSKCSYILISKKTVNLTIVK